jgi:hypothetical protein
MGGMGSGPGSVRQRKETLENRVCISVTDLQGRGVFTSEESVRWSQRGAEGQPVQIVAKTVGDMVVIVTGYLDAQGKRQAPAMEVTVSWTDCRFGGRRPWFTCPAWPDGGPCEQRVAKLYLSEFGHLTCRRCAGLGYKSDHLNSRQRLLHRARKIRLRLGGSASLSDPFPPRPSGMHRDTYHICQVRMGRLLEEYRMSTADALAEAQAMAGMSGLMDEDGSG